MFSLVQFKDDLIYSVCRTNRVRINILSTLCMAPYGKFHYPAVLLAKSDDQKILQTVCVNLEKHIPYLILKDFKEDEDRDPTGVRFSNSELLSSNKIIDPLQEASENISDQLTIQEISVLSSVNTFEDSTYLPDSSCTLNLSDQTIKFPPPTHKGKRTFATTNFVPNCAEGSKKNYCCYCKKLVTKIARHWTNVHSKFPEILEILKLPKKSKERREKLQMMKREANFHYNTEQQLFQKGTLIVQRRPRKSEHRNEKHYLPCANCKGFYSKLNLRNHFCVCTSGKFRNSKQTQALARRLRSSIHENACDLLRNKIFPILREDETINEIRYDELVIIYCNNLCTKFASRPQCYALIRNKIRKIAFFLSEMRSINTEIESLTDVFHPKRFDNIMKVLNIMGKYNEESGIMATPSTAFDMGTQLKVLCDILRCEYIKNSDEDKLKQTEQMALLLKQGLQTSLNVNVREAQISQNRAKKITLPSNEDIAKLMLHLYSNQTKYYNLLIHATFSKSNWIKLTQFTLLCVQTFNRRRPGETERILIEDFNRRDTITEQDNPDLYKSLTRKEQEMVKKYSRFEIRGKKVKNVPVLLNKETEESIKLILHYRLQAGVPENNPYVFGQPYSPRAAFEHRFYRVCPLLRQNAIDCKAVNPKTLRCIELRKHVATQAAVLHSKYGFKTNELARFMGHNENIHKSHYRLPDVQKQITGIGCLLEFLQGTNKFLQDTNKDIGSKRLRCDIEEPSSFHNDPSLQLDNAKTLHRGNLFKKKKNQSSPDAATVEGNISSNSYFMSGTSCSFSSDNGTSVERKINSSNSNAEFVNRRSWSTSEKKIGMEMFKNNIESGQLPSAFYIRQVLKEFSQITRTEAQVRSWVQHKINQGRKRNYFEGSERKFPNDKVYADYCSSSSSEECSPIKKRRRSLSSLGKEFISRRSWSTPEKTVVMTAFKENLDLRILPKSSEIRYAKRNFPELETRSEAQIRSWVQNKIKEQRRHKDDSNKNIFWSPEEKSSIKKHFAKNLLQGECPSIDECQRFILTDINLQKKTAVQIQKKVKGKICRLFLEERRPF